MNNNDKPSFWYISSYPRSGNTWCRLFISKILKFKKLKETNPDFSLNQDLDFDLNNDLVTGSIVSNKKWINDIIGVDCSYLRHNDIEKIRARNSYESEIYNEIPRFHKIHDNFNTFYQPYRPIVPLDGCQGIIYLVRHPADIVVSLSSFNGWNIEESLSFILNQSAFLNETRSQVSQFLSSWDKHVLSWVKQNKVPMLVIKYEDLLGCPKKNFSKIARFLNLKLNDEVLDIIIKSNTIDNLQLDEKNQGYFKEKPFKCKSFFRKGISGEGQSVLTSDQLYKLNNAFQKTMKLFNYL